MLEQIKLNLYFFWKTSWMTLLIFWLIYASFILFMLIITISFDGGIEMIGVNTFPSMIFFIIFGIYFFRETFSNVIKFGITRMSYYVSLMIYIVLFSILMTTISQLFIQLIDLLIEIFNISNFTFTGIDLNMIENVSQWEFILYEVLIYILLFLFSLLLASIFYRFGLKIGFLTLLVFPLSFVFRDVAEIIFDALGYLLIGSEKYQAFYFLIPYLVLALILLLLTKRLSVVDQVTYK
ncbi:hypothetical protein [Gracilibacillus massiliensis]|uniref:hypothetical protein n=1 Tax=Gracilibacillus massiliensis TaxID=1564956 RepID=UPI00071DBBDC|nr:hypothetical protein [Gracilibacillus massiliensis]